VGAPESELGGYLPAVAGSQGKLITLVYNEKWDQKITFIGRMLIFIL